MQQIIERQKVVDEYRSMMMEGMSLIPLESNLYKNDLVVVSQTIQMIEVNNFWHLKTFEAVLTKLWDELIHKQKHVSMLNWMEKKLLTCVVKIRPQTSELHNGEENTKQNSQDKMKSKQLQGWRAKIGLKKISKQLKLKKTKQQ